MSAWSPPPDPPEQHEFVPTGSSSDEDDEDISDDLVIATHHLQVYVDQGRRRRPFAVPPAPAVMTVPWLGIGGAAPAPAASIDALPTVEVSEPGAVCAICREDLPVAVVAAARRLPCGHLYHSSCIVPWLQVRNSCPVCRSRLPSNPAEPREVVEEPSSSEQDARLTAGTDHQSMAQAASGDDDGEEASPRPSDR